MLIHLHKQATTTPKVRAAISPFFKVEDGSLSDMESLR